MSEREIDVLTSCTRVVLQDTQFDSVTFMVISGYCCPCFRNEPQHDKISKMTCAPSEDSDQPGNLSSLNSLRGDSKD